MGRTPSTCRERPLFRFSQTEVAEMESQLKQPDNNGAIPNSSVIQALADRFTASGERVGTVGVQPKQVRQWFQNWKHPHRSRKYRKTLAAKTDEQTTSAIPAASAGFGSSSGKCCFEGGQQVEFEAKSTRDGAWYDVATFLSYRSSESGDPKVRVHFSGLGAEEDEWTDVRKCVRQRSLRCASSECASILPGDLVLCFQERKQHTIYFDAHVVNIHNRRHDVIGCFNRRHDCRCRFLVRYVHDQSEEIVPLRKVCHRPETDYRIQILNAARAAGATKADQDEDNRM